jgi:HEAT repeat protein
MIDPSELKRALGSPARLIVPSSSTEKHQLLAVLVEAALDAQEPEQTAAIAALQKAIESQEFQDQLRFEGRPPKVSPLPSRLIELLDSSNRVLRFLGASFLRAVWMPVALPRMLRGLDDEDPQVQDACLSALRGRKGRKLEPGELREHLSSERDTVQYVALRLLASLQDPHLIAQQPCPFQEELQRVFEAPAATAPVRACAAALLESTPELPGLWEATLDAVRTESDEDIRHLAMGRLGGLHQEQAKRTAELTQAVSAALKKNPESDWLFAIIALSSIVLIDDAALEALIDALRFIPESTKSNSPQQKVMNVLSKAAQNPERVIPRLLAALENPKFMGSARAGVVHALTFFLSEGRFPQELIAVFVKALREPSGHVVEEAANALQRGGDKETLTPLLLQMLEDPTLLGIGRCGVALVLGYFEERAAIPQLVYLLEQEDPMFPMHEVSWSRLGAGCILEGVDVPRMKLDAAYRLGYFGRLALEALPTLVGNLLAPPGPFKDAVAVALAALKPARDELEAAFSRVREKMLRQAHGGRGLDKGEQERVEGQLWALIDQALAPRENLPRVGRR